MKRSPLRRKRATPRRSGRLHWPGYLDAVRSMGCVVADMVEWGTRCEGRIHAHHMREAGFAGMGRKPSDDFATPLCALHHAEWHAASGTFKNWDRDMRGSFATGRVRDTQAVVLPMLEARGIKRPGGQG